MREPEQSIPWGERYTPETRTVHEQDEIPAIIVGKDGNPLQHETQPIGFRRNEE